VAATEAKPEEPVRQAEPVQRPASTDELIPLPWSFPIAPSAWSGTVAPRSGPKSSGPKRSHRRCWDGSWRGCILRPPPSPAGLTRESISLEVDCRAKPGSEAPSIHCPA